MSLILVTHELSLQHRNPRGHPERAERVTATADGLRSGPYDIVEVEAPPVSRDLLETVHDAAYVEDVHRLCIEGGGSFDQDTYVVPASWEAALHAAGGGPAAAECLLHGTGDVAFVVARPPGHHAERALAMGFCLFNNIAVTAAFLRARGDRVAIVDWDVHHGNGTQRTFWRDPDVLYVSLHEFPFYPGTGWVTEVGAGPGSGFTVNVPIPPGTSRDDHLACFARVVPAVVGQFAPDWILVSAGYDAHRDDPLGGLNLEGGSYGEMAATLAGFVGKGRTIAFLEGGYDLAALGEGSRATVEGLLGMREPLLSDGVAHGSAGKVLELAVEAIAPHWELG